MSSSSPIPVRRRRGLIFAAVATALTIVGFGAQQALSAASQALSPDVHAVAQTATAEDGYIADGVVVRVSDSHVPAIAHLDQELLDALQRASSDAAADGVDVLVTSGWRSVEYQEQLRAEAIVSRGSEAEAARWVARPADSEHVTGKAVDVGPWAALDWLAQFGAAYGLCQIYQNEPWHYELRPEAIAEGYCPQVLTDASESGAGV